MNSEKIIANGARSGAVIVPPSKSHEHRLLIANFLAGERSVLEPSPGDNADITATKRCLLALDVEDHNPVLDCGESGSTLRFLAPVAAALGKEPEYIRRGRLAERPFNAYRELRPGRFEIAGNISSQFVTGLLFALPLLDGDSEIVFTSPLESRGYVDMTLSTIAKAGIKAGEVADGFRIKGGQRFSPQPHEVEGDWSGAAFWYGMNALGSKIEIGGLSGDSAQPDRVIAELANCWRTEIDVSQCPDLFPVLAVMAAGKDCTTVFTGTARLRLKECDRAAAMREALEVFGIEAIEEESRFTVKGTGGLFRGGYVKTRGDHRIAMAAAVGATHASAPVTIDNCECVSKSYPGFFEIFEEMKAMK